jgi:hypothetical protein
MSYAHSVILPTTRIDATAALLGRYLIRLCVCVFVRSLIRSFAGLRTRSLSLCSSIILRIRG